MRWHELLAAAVESTLVVILFIGIIVALSLAGLVLR